MPIYAYKCESCGHRQDVLQKMSDALLTECPACHAQTYVKQLTAAGFQLKGSGWYVTDFRDGNKGGPAKGDGDADKPADKAADKVAEKAADKPADKTDAAAPAPAPTAAAPAPSPAPAAPAPAPSAPSSGSK